MIAIVAAFLLADPASQPASQASSFPIIEPQVVVSAPVEPPEPKNVTPFMRDVRIDYGFKGTIMTAPSYRALGMGALQPQSALGVTWAAWSYGRFALAPGFHWEASRATGYTRGGSAAHSTHRVLLSLEARYRPLRWLDVFGRGAAGVIASELDLGDLSGAPVLKAKNATITGDVALGLDLLFGPHKRISQRRARVWMTLEGGYSFSAPMALSLAPQLASDDPRRTGNTDGGVLNLQGPFFRMSLTLAL